MTEITINGCEYDFDAVVNMMDDELREKIHAEGIEDPQTFADEYAKEHEAKFGVAFEV